MHTLKSRKDGFRLLFPKEFLAEEIEEKYAKILQKQHSFIVSPIDFLNETIQSIQILGFQEATVMQQQSVKGTWASMQETINANRFMHTSSEYPYRSEVSPIQLIDKTLNVTFRHTLGFVNYFMLFENFFVQYRRDTKYSDLIDTLYIDILNEHGAVYSRVEISNPLLNSMDMLDLTYSEPIAASQTFQVVFKYSNIDFQFIEEETGDDNYMLEENFISGNM